MDDTKQVPAVGRRKPPAAGMGRPKGTPNKTTRLLKEAILMAAEQSHQEGVVGYLKVQAIENPGPFMALLGKVLPMQISGDPDAPLVTRITITSPGHGSED